MRGTLLIQVETIECQHRVPAEQGYPVQGYPLLCGTQSMCTRIELLGISVLSRPADVAILAHVRTERTGL